MTHTPGPWTAEFHERAGLSPIVRGADRSPVAQVLRRIPNGRESHSNATLIAAAPELLAACKLQHQAIDILLARLVRADPTFFPSKSGIPWDAIIAGNFAIAKAEQPP